MKIFYKKCEAVESVIRRNYLEYIYHKRKYCLLVKFSEMVFISDT
ncbi:hypothetical protein ECH_0357 [Ehrlichia chaffeensis str. Arkansas]|uniref:Uncharacterized protein n=1 Tax=Ehrlichia chaffeensis (strain ATCC CRL-10679 / Arkansas) TaxID=205920 RepID=Q2GHA6_EHRCR|nr:hypothetical protein ECH_0357 [Ehrlichia chaffeensis str. Arkansas]AHX07184.1 hypothetical protein ECHOSC_0314 [Ehrlichia chaffeensis str. Osceola]